MSMEMATNLENTGFDNPQRGEYFRSKLPGGLVVILFVLFLVWGLVTLAHPDTLPIKQVRVEGNFTRLSPVALKSRVKNKVRGGFFNLNVDAVRLSLLEEPWVNHVTVKRTWPDALSVTVIEQIPVARWNEKGLLNSEGEYFAPGVRNFPQKLPLLSGPKGTQSLLLARFKAMQEALNAIGYDLATIVLDDRRAWTFTLTNGMKVVLGRRDIEKRFNRFLLLLPMILSGQIEQADLIDMRYTNGFSIRRKIKVKTALNLSACLLGVPAGKFITDVCIPGYVNRTSRYIEDGKTANADFYKHRATTRCNLSSVFGSLLAIPPGVAGTSDVSKGSLNDLASNYRRSKHG